MSDTGPEGLSAAREQRLGVRAAMGHVEAALATASSGRAVQWSAAVSEQLSVLAKSFQRHIDVTEGPGGLLSEIVADAPRLAYQVERLRKDHVAIKDAIEDAMGTVQPGAMPGESVDTARQKVMQLLARISEHRQTGADLVYDAYSVDIEAAD